MSIPDDDAETQLPVTDPLGALYQIYTSIKIKNDLVGALRALDAYATHQVEIERKRLRVVKLDKCCPKCSSVGALRFNRHTKQQVVCDAALGGCGTAWQLLSEDQLPDHLRAQL